MRPLGGDSIDYIARFAIELRDQVGKPVVFKFNDTVVVVGPQDTIQTARDAYMAPIEAAHKAYWTPERLAEKEARETAFKAEMDAAYETLPRFLKDWVDSCSDRNYGRNLDIAIARDAHLVATALKTPDAIREWYDKPSDEQLKAVPGLSDGHSGFSFAQMTKLALAYLDSESKRA